MDEGVSIEDIMLFTQSDSLMDLDYMDEPLFEGCWFETADGSEFLHQSPSDFNALFDFPFSLPTLEDNTGFCSPSKGSQEETQRSSVTENLSVSESQGRDSSKWDENANNAVCSSSHSGNSLAEASELGRRRWIGPRHSGSVIDRLIMALGFIKDLSRDKDVLIQIWVPINKGGRHVLSTSNQPFSLDVTCPRLACYRDISVHYQFPADEDSKEVVGLPGRVFNGKVPEWTPDVQFFRKDEYPRVGHAEQYNVRGTLAVPIFEQGNRNCLGVIEVVLTTRKINYGPELESVCKALEAVELRSSDVPSTQDSEAREFSFQAALPEIKQVLRVACETHRLPLAQAWVPCMQQGKKGSRHSDENIIHCVSTVDSVCCIADSSIKGFHEACSEHHLLKGLGIVGRAFTTNQPCFSPDITSYSKTEYPLSHHARMFGLRAAVAIRLRSIYTGSTDFALEFFLPLDCKDPEDQKEMLSSLSIIIQKVCQSLRVVSDKELQEEAALLTGGTSIPSAIRQSEKIPEIEHSQAMIMASQERSSRTSSHHADVVDESFSFVSEVQNQMAEESLVGTFSEFGQCDPNAGSKMGIPFHDSHLISDDSLLLTANKTGEKKRSKAEKTITLQILRQYFAGSLKDAAKSIGVCPTTLKRICRQHGIKRWPSRKIKKVGHSLQKIQRVIDSVQGASGDLQIESFYRNFPELASPNVSRTGPFSSAKSGDDDPAEPLKTKLEDGVLDPQVVVSTSSPSSSCSQSSSSSQCCSTGTQKHPPPPLPPHPFPLPPGIVSASEQDESVNCLLKRVRSDAQLHLSSEVPKLLPRSHSHVSLIEHHPISGNTPPAPKESDQNHHQEEISQRIKVTYGEEKIRFRMQSNWGFGDLMREAARRFGITDTDGFLLKYLDDDSEWVLMTCDDDLEECLDVCRSSSQAQTMKLLLLGDSQQHHGSSSGTSCLRLA